MAGGVAAISPSREGRRSRRSPGSKTSISQFWHPICRSEWVADRPQRYRLLGRDLVAFRTAEGASVLDDLCIHRGAALSLGTVKGRRIVCPYHGWEYDARGRCTRIPALPSDRAISPRARVPSYRVQEKYGLVWVAMEEPVAPIPALLERRLSAESELRGGFALHVTWETSAGRAIENSMDVSHFPFVHPGILGDPGDPEQPPYKLIEEDWGIRFRLDNMKRWSVDGSREFNVSYEYFHEFPFTMHIRILEGDGRVSMLSVFASPTDVGQTNVFRFMHRNYDDTGVQSRDDYLHVLEQDRRVTESIRPEQIPQDLKEELHIRVPDLASVAYRRWLSGVDMMGLLSPT